MISIKAAVKTYKNLMISGLILVFCLFGFVFGVFPAVQKVQELLGDSRTLMDQTKNLNAKLQALNAMDEEALRQKLAVVISAVPSDKSLPTVFSTVEGVAAQSGVSVVSVNIGGGSSSLATQSAQKQTAQEKQLGTRIIPFSVTIHGTLDAIQRFITLAPQVRRLLRIRTFTITFLSLEQPVSIALEMDAFYQPLPSTVGTTTAALPAITDEEEETISKITEFGLVSGDELALPPPNFDSIKPNPFVP